MMKSNPFYCRVIYVDLRSIYQTEVYKYAVLRREDSAADAERRMAQAKIHGPTLTSDIV